jgi:hypothetical protein
VLTGHKVESTFERDIVEIEKVLNRKGRFILATNDLDIENYTDEQILEEYKEQQNVERGFRFLKDPWFIPHSADPKPQNRFFQGTSKHAKYLIPNFIHIEHSLLNA